MAKTHCGICTAPLPPVHPVILIDPKLMPGGVPGGTLTVFVHFCDVRCVWKGGELDARGVEFVGATNDRPRTFSAGQEG